MREIEGTSLYNWLEKLAALEVKMRAIEGC
jgi:hypothetical protein